MDSKKRKSLQRELQAVEDIYAGTLDWLELGELHSWVEAGNSPCTNPEQVIHEDGTFFDFIEWHRTARWVPVREPFDVSGPSDRELFDFYTDRRSAHGSFEETKKFLRDAQTFLGCEILTLMDFLREKGLLYAYLHYKYPERLTGEEELPF
mgnify:CR=1 FL=1